jgi:sulfatase modifying factor 1
MKHLSTVLVILSGALALLPGCARKTPSDGTKTPAATPNPQSEIRHPQSDSGAMVLLPGGRFTMGDKEEADATPHEVSVSPFYIDKYLVTQEQYQRVMGDNPSRWKGPQNPVEQVRWSDAVKFCNARSRREGLTPCYDLQTWQCSFEANGYRLPTEAEWEYACRAGATTTYFFGNDASQLGDYAWFEKNAGGHPQPVGQKKPNPAGLYDICGDVWQWCNDFYKVDYYAAAPAENPRGPQEGDTKVVRGGAWKFSAENCRAGYRYNENPGYVDVCFGYDIYGFRCVRNAPRQ